MYYCADMYGCKLLLCVFASLEDPKNGQFIASLLPQEIVDFNIAIILVCKLFVTEASIYLFFHVYQSYGVATELTGVNQLN